MDAEAFLQLTEPLKLHRYRMFFSNPRRYFKAGIYV